MLHCWGPWMMKLCVHSKTIVLFGADKTAWCFNTERTSIPAIYALWGVAVVLRFVWKLGVRSTIGLEEWKTWMRWRGLYFFNAMLNLELHKSRIICCYIHSYISFLLISGTIHSFQYIDLRFCTVLWNILFFDRYHFIPPVQVWPIYVDLTFLEPVGRQLKSIGKVKFFVLVHFLADLV